MKGGGSKIEEYRARIEGLKTVGEMSKMERRGKKEGRKEGRVEGV